MHHSGVLTATVLLAVCLPSAREMPDVSFAERVATIARYEASRRQSSAIDSGDVLNALVRSSERSVTRVLAECSISTQALVGAIDDVRRREPGVAPTDAMLRVAEAASQRAAASGRGDTDALDFMLAAAGDEDGIAWSSLERVKTNLEALESAAAIERRRQNPE